MSVGRREDGEGSAEKQGGSLTASRQASDPTGKQANGSQRCRSGFSPGAFPLVCPSPLVIPPHAKEQRQQPRHSSRASAVATTLHGIYCKKGRQTALRALLLRARKSNRLGRLAKE